MTTTMTAEIEDFYDRVLAALADLTDDELNELLEDLPDHLAEVAAEPGGTLIDRLGTPEEYAAELRAAAGLPSPEDAPDQRARLADQLHQLTELGDRLDLRAGRLVGYPRLRDLLRAVQPGWWVLRGWIVAQLVAHNTQTYSLRAALIPRVSGSLLLGFAYVLVGIVASVWFGRRSLDFGLWPRRAIGVAGFLLALWSAVVLAGRVNFHSYFDNGGYEVSNTSPADSAFDVYVYDQGGHLVPHARLYDQSGNALNIGSGTCADGTVAEAAESSQFNYPLCPQDSGPFGSGPGALPSASASPPAAPSASVKPSVPKASPTG